MSVFANMPIGEQGPGAAVGELVASLLRAKAVDGVLAPMATRDGRTAQPALITDPARARHIAPFLPIMTIHSARMASLLTGRGKPPEGEKAAPEKRIAAIMRPCELRATIELAKLHQIRISQLMLIGVDCVGTLDPRRMASSDLEAGACEQAVLAAARSGSPDAPDGLAYRSACRICETSTPWNAEVSIHTLGVPALDGLLVEAETPDMLAKLGLSQLVDGTAYLNAARSFAQSRHARRQEELDRIDALLQPDPEGTPGLVELFEACQRCHNCTVACPICYCKECLFRTDTLAHEPRTYFGWAARKGAARLPGDTIAFQLTRMAHVTTSCVGCGMCTTACPADLPVDSVFQAVARKTQGLFDYVPGRALDDALPPATFDRTEFVELGEVRR